MSIVVTRLLGGLANQMFQYAVGRQLAVSNGALLRFDTRDLSEDPLRKYELDVFDHRGAIASTAELDFFRAENGSHFTKLVEAGYHFDRSVLTATAPLYLSGYWQSAKYFPDIPASLKKDFTLVEPLSPLSTKWSAQIGSCNSVSIHVRRGDYVTNPHTSKYHGIVSREYLQNAIKLIHSLEPDAQFFVFSDDLDWAAENLQTVAPMHLVEGNLGPRAAEDLVLMSQCRHHIMSNSSFSWWATWLGADPEGRVVAPTPWFQAPGLDTRDLIQDGWILMRI